MPYKAYDDSGNEIFLTEINTLCPIQYLEEAKLIAYNYFVEVEKSKEVLMEQMFTKFVRPIGTVEATHVWCPRTGYTNQLVMQTETMASYDLPWIANRVYTLQDNHEEILSKFICLTENSSLILESLGLEVI